MAIKGYLGAVNNKDAVHRWWVDAPGTRQPVAASNTKAAVIELEGVTDWRGGYAAWGHTPSSMPGEALSFAGSIGTDIDKTLEGTAIVERVRIDWDWANNRAITHEVDFGGNGALSTGTTDCSDSSNAAWYMTGDTVLKTGAPASPMVYATLPNVIAASLTIWNEVEPYANSSTTNQIRRAKGNLHWMVDVACHIEDTAAQQTLDGATGIRLFVDATTYWQIEWVRWKRVGPVVVDIMGRTLVASQYRGFGAGYTKISGTWTEGNLTNPATTAVWPV